MSIHVSHFGNSGLIFAWIAVALPFAGMLWHYRIQGSIGRTTGYLLIVFMVSLVLLGIVYGDNGQLQRNAAPGYIVNLTASCVLAAATVVLGITAWVWAWRRNRRYRVIESMGLAFVASMTGVLAANLWLYTDWQGRHTVFTSGVECALVVLLAATILSSMITIILGLGIGFSKALNAQKHRNRRRQHTASR